MNKLLEIKPRYLLFYIEVFRLNGLPIFFKKKGLCGGFSKIHNIRCGLIPFVEYNIQNFMSQHIDADVGRSTFFS